MRIQYFCLSEKLKKMNRASDLWCLTQHFSRQQNIEKYILTNSRLSNQTVESLNILKMTIFTCTLFHLRNASVAFGSATRTGIVYSYLPGTGDTLINKGVLPGRGLSIALRWADPCDRLKCRWLGCVISWWGGLRSRYPLLKQINGITHLILTSIPEL